MEGKSFGINKNLEVLKFFGVQKLLICSKES